MVYSLMKPVIRAAARFRLPMRTLAELLRLAYFEHLSREGRAVGEIAEHFGQTPRHMRTLARRLESDFFQPERDVALVREVEALVGARSPMTDAQVVAALPSWDARDVHGAVARLVDDERLERDPAGQLCIAKRYVVLRSDEFHHRIDSLNHLLDGTYRAVLHRLVFDDRVTSLMKTISFSALAGELVAFVQRLEGELRRELAVLDENATFAGHGDDRYTLGITLAPAGESPRVPEDIP
jgi:hypothetical protein